MPSCLTAAEAIDLLLGAALPSMQAARDDKEKRDLIADVLEGVLDLENPPPTMMLAGLLIGSRGLLFFIARFA